MKLNDLSARIKQHKIASSRSWLTYLFPPLAQYPFFQRSFSRQLSDLETTVAGLTGNHSADREMTLTESHQICTVLFRKDDPTTSSIYTPDEWFITNLRPLLIDGHMQNCHDARTTLYRHKRLTDRYWSVLEPRRHESLTALTKLLCSIPEKLLTDEVLETIKSSYTTTPNIIKVIKLLHDNNCLTSDMLSILKYTYLDHEQMAESLVECKTYGATGPAITRKLIGMGDNRILSYKKTQDEFMQCVRELHALNLINQQTIPVIFGMNMGIKTTTEGLKTLQEAGILEYANAIHGTYGRYHPDIIAKVLVLLNHFGRLSHELVATHIIQHRSPEVYFDSLNLLRENNCRKPEYVDYILVHLGMDTLPVIQLALKLDDANIDFDFKELPDLKAKIAILINSDLLTQANFNNIKAMPSSRPALAHLNDLSELKVITQAILDDLLTGTLSTNQLYDQLRNELSETGTRPNREKYELLFGAPDQPNQTLSVNG